VTNGRRLVREDYDWDVVGDVLWQLYTDLVEKSAACLEAK
jgi:hypothetical protein